MRDEWDYGTLNVESECVCCWEEGDGDDSGDGGYDNGDDDGAADGDG